ncbi:unnamed protein product [Notodromas monacha]|uniref:Uncharacterized protein n=1 Tax=Notodromas monacha TaxID=399045 RepID=A0A7R9G8J2_9CRUS|nr:unnamed protein product [Notodromas monacha]CAG0913338.1 unnamed protein product [Notodromas monacha]
MLHYVPSRVHGIDLDPDGLMAQKCRQYLPCNEQPSLPSLYFFSQGLPKEGVNVFATILHTHLLGIDPGFRDASDEFISTRVEIVLTEYTFDFWGSRVTLWAGEELMRQRGK